MRDRELLLVALLWSKFEGTFEGKEYAFINHHNSLASSARSNILSFARG
jgi:hypothetical protein